jgi:hypothetical protein
MSNMRLVGSSLLNLRLKNPSFGYEGALLEPKNGVISTGWLAIGMYLSALANAGNIQLALFGWY